ncbi:hypothetical protein [Asaia astilbis]|uniref:hypothetical protein n=1 Tax=Asaia astilbis TaxID=610244 RepID=UPI00046FC803|nr:hypothetical protein [Asaia astilbis]
MSTETRTVTVRVLPGRVFIHDDARVDEGDVITLSAAQADTLIKGGHVERVDDVEPEEPKKKSGTDKTQEQGAT